METEISAALWAQVAWERLYVCFMLCSKSAPVTVKYVYAACEFALIDLQSFLVQYIHILKVASTTVNINEFGPSIT